MDVKALSQYKNVLLSIVIIVVFAVLSQGTLSYYSLQKKEVTVRMQELEEGEQTIMRWERLRLDAEKLEKSFLVKDTLFFKKFVEEKANSLGIRITFLRTSNLEKDLYWEVTMHLGMACSYKDFTDFIKAIEEKSVVVKNVSITSGQNVKDEKIDLTLKGFILK